MVSVRTNGILKFLRKREIEQCTEEKGQENTLEREIVDRLRAARFNGIRCRAVEQNTNET